MLNPFMFSGIRLVSGHTFSMETDVWLKISENMSPTVEVSDQVFVLKVGARLAPTSIETYCKFH